jgi:hypothetical protein
MAATGASIFPANLSLVFCLDATSSSVRKSKPKQISFSQSPQRFAVSTDQQPKIATTKTSCFSGSGRLEKREEAEPVTATMSEDPAVERGSLRDYFERSKELLSKSDGGPPRWFTPLVCGPPMTNSPLLLFLPGYPHTPIFSYLISVIGRFIISDNIIRRLYYSDHFCDFILPWKHFPGNDFLFLGKKKKKSIFSSVLFLFLYFWKWTEISFPTN